MVDIFPDHIIMPPRGIGAAVIFLTKPSAVATNAFVGSVVAVVIVPIVNCSFIVRPVLVSVCVSTSVSCIVFCCCIAPVNVALCEYIVSRSLLEFLG